MLVRKGELTRSNLALASNKMRAQRERLGTTLVSLGLLSQHQLQTRLAEQVQGIIYSLFTWNDGEFRFQPESSAIETDVPIDVPIDLPTVPIILEGTRRMKHEVVRSALGDVNRIVGYTKDPRVITHYANLTPQEGFVLSRVDGASSLSDIVSISPLTEAETLRCLYGLLASGFLEIGAKSREVAPSEARRQTPIEIFHRTSAPAPTVPKPVKGPLSTTEELRMQADIEAKHRALAGGTYFDWLEVRRTAETKEIKKAFAAMVMRYHPDRHRPAVVDAVGSKLEAILTKLTQAHETLCDSQARRRYENSMRTEAPKGDADAKSATPPKAAPKPPTPSEDMAERYYLEAKKFYAQRDYHEVVKLMEEAVGIGPSKVRYQCLLAQALSRNPKWRKNAEECFKIALRIDPFDTESLVGLAELYEAVGLTRRAQSLYAEAVEIDPGNAILRMKLGALES
jgi:hypothetical protein